MKTSSGSGEWASVSEKGMNEGSVAGGCWERPGAGSRA